MTKAPASFSRLVLAGTRTADLLLFPGGYKSERDRARDPESANLSSPADLPSPALPSPKRSSGFAQAGEAGFAKAGAGPSTEGSGPRAGFGKAGRRATPIVRAKGAAAASGSGVDLDRPAERRLAAASLAMGTRPDEPKGRSLQGFLVQN